MRLIHREGGERESQRERREGEESARASERASERAREKFVHVCTDTDILILKFLTASPSLGRAIVAL